MKVLICVKPIREEILHPDKKQGGKYLINPYELKALKNSVRLKEEKEDISITCLCLGPESAKSVLVRCLGLGADDAVLLSDAGFAGSDSLATSFALYQAISCLGHFDLIICGTKSIDGETGQVPFGLAERLGYRWQTNVEELLEITKDRLILKKAEKDVMTVIESPMPLVLIYHSFTIDTETMDLKQLKRARTREIVTMGYKDLKIDRSRCGVLGSKTKVIGSMPVRFDKKTRTIEGTSQQKTDFIINTLKQINLGAD